MTAEVAVVVAVRCPTRTTFGASGGQTALSGTRCRVRWHYSIEVGAQRRPQTPNRTWVRTFGIACVYRLVSAALGKAAVVCCLCTRGLARKLRREHTESGLGVLALQAYGCSRRSCLVPHDGCNSSARRWAKRTLGAPTLRGAHGPRRRARHVCRLDRRHALYANAVLEAWLSTSAPSR